MITGVIAVVLIAAIVGGTILFSKKDENQPVPTSSQLSNSATSDTVSNSGSNSANQNVSSTSYKDGTFSANGSYSTPGGTESIKVTVTLSGGTVASSNIETQPNSRESGEYQADFQANYKDQVNGKSIVNLVLSRVAGSSLTSRGFNQALNDIRNQAKV